ncbi:MAG: dihydrofolate reductase family protein [Chloroflexota bacterium]|nr:dihydrofolate reductase family protein [Chloroflexota bacterium]MDE2894322.1 dihydrofolate reductase family protein [Chloroflexota bacterium]
MPQLDPGEIDYTALSFPDPPPDRPFVAINMVMSADGRTVIDGTERGLGSKLDQRLMRELRVHFDVVMNGGATFRASGTSARLNDPGLEQWRLDRGMTPSPIAAVLTRSGDLPPERRFFTDDGFEAVIYLSSAAPDAVRRELETRGRPVVSVQEGSEAVAALAHTKGELGASRVLVEGGATLNGDLMRHGLVDEYFLTLAPRIAGGESAHPAVQWPGEPTAEGIRQLSLVHAITAGNGEAFLRYRLQRSHS